MRKNTCFLCSKMVATLWILFQNVYALHSLEAFGCPSLHLWGKWGFTGLDVKNRKSTGSHIHIWMTNSCALFLRIFTVVMWRQQICCIRILLLNLKCYNSENFLGNRSLEEEDWVKITQLQNWVFHCNYIMSLMAGESNFILLSCWL